ncbi:hypothetical protein EV189_0789 [Motilibacter rhizosphaerae]|uniref:Uncharacterized protein n=1 Tax=Motilibacter rhizosphaerae TaxID=598652 RepID=A0A4Q7NWF8_9ACTN|nr:zinc ribbon domain-containing protein [Motilibacter rhizosphaerae]RZS91547.1 hypothetical protein EV189_0789 [Motilibacter rhizosphaerae]
MHRTAPLDEAALAARLLDTSTCPVCGTPLRGSTCSACGARLASPAGTELAGVSRDAAQLLLRRADLLRALPVAVRPAPALRPEASPRSVQQVLVALGALLLGTAALAFTVVSWGGLGIAGRAAVLVAVTAAAAGACRQVLARGLPRTAEALAVLTALLLLLDAYAARAATPALGQVPPAAWWAGVLGALGAAALTGRRSRLRTPATGAALALGGASWVLGDAVGTPARGLAPVLGSAFLLVLVPALGHRSSRWTARVTAVVLWGAALLTATVVLADPGAAALGGGSATAVAAAVLAAAAATAAARAVKPRAALVGYAAAPLALVAAVTAAAGHRLAADRVLALVALLAVVLWGAAAGHRLPLLARAGTRCAALLAAGCAALGTLPALAAALAAPLTALDRSRDWTLPHAVATTAYADLDVSAGLVATLLLGAGLALLAARDAAERRPVARAAAAGLISAAVVLVPLLAGLRTDAAAVGLALVGSAAALLVRSRWERLAGASVATVGLAWAAGDARLTAVVASLGALAALLLARRSPAERPVALPSALAAGALAAAAAAHSAGAAPAWAALAPVAVAAAGVVLAAWTRDRPTELAAVAVGLLAGLVVGQQELEPAVSAALALAGAAAALVALVPERRSVGWVAGLLLTAATWSRLDGAEVRLVEAYTLPPAVALAVAGALLGRRSSDARSWTAYGPALLVGLVPSLLQGLSEPGAARPLAVAVAAAAVTLVGARSRLQAPLAVGGGVLVVDALDQVGPAVAALPRWLVLAVLGCALLAVGARYEQRLAGLAALRTRWRSWR